MEVIFALRDKCENDTLQAIKMIDILSLSKVIIKKIIIKKKAEEKQEMEISEKSRGKDK